jgi:hypothetical protein
VINPVVKLTGKDSNYIIDLDEVVFIKAGIIEDEGWIEVTTADGIGHDMCVEADDLNTVFEDLYAKLRKVKEEKNALIQTLNTI